MKEMRKSTAIAKDGIKSDTEGNSRASSSDNESSSEEASVTSSVLSRADSFELGEETAEQLHWLTLSQNTQDPFADYHSDWTVIDDVVPPTGKLIQTFVKPQIFYVIK